MQRLVSTIVFASMLALLLVSPALAEGSVQTESMYDFNDPYPEIDGSQATLKRQNNKVNVNIKTSGLEAGATYTVWFIVFNNPGECSPNPEIDPIAPSCGEDDLPFMQGANLAVMASGHFGAGHMVGNNGKGNFAGNLKEGDTDGALFGEDYGLIDSDKAEIHAIVRNHGPHIRGYVNEQISTLGGGCDVNTEGTLPVGVGNVCFDDQFTIFE